MSKASALVHSYLSFELRLSCKYSHPGNKYRHRPTRINHRSLSSTVPVLRLLRDMPDTKATPQAAKDFLEFVNASPTRMEPLKIFIPRPDLHSQAASLHL